MMLRQTAIPFNDTGKMIAGAMHDAGATDREIADACNTSVNNIIWWRRETSRVENMTEEAKARAAEEAWSPPVNRPATASLASATAPQLLSPQEAQSAHVSVVTPTGDDAIEIGSHMDAKVLLDLPEMLTTRLLIQGNSGSGKTHLLRRLLEECTGIVQQIIIDPEGDFVSFGEVFGHTVIEAKDHKPSRLRKIAARVRTLRGSVVVSLEGLFIDQQMEAVAAFLGGLFDADAEHWHPAIVAIDEAHLFAPSGSNGEDADARKASLQAMANLMCRGRKRGLAGVIATQRLAKIAKNVAAEASNFLMGRTYLDIDISRAADLLGISQRDSEQIRNLSRGEFIGLGPAIARRTIKVKVGPVMTQGRAGQEKGITPLPTLRPEEMQAALLAEDEAEDETPAVVVPFARKA